VLVVAQVIGLAVVVAVDELDAAFLVRLTAFLARAGGEPAAVAEAPVARLLGPGIAGRPASHELVVARADRDAHRVLAAALLFRQPARDARAQPVGIDRRGCHRRAHAVGKLRGHDRARAQRQTGHFEAEIDLSIADQTDVAIRGGLARGAGGVV